MSHLYAVANGAEIADRFCTFTTGSVSVENWQKSNQVNQLVGCPNDRKQFWGFYRSFKITKKRARKEICASFRTRDERGRLAIQVSLETRENGR